MKSKFIAFRSLHTPIFGDGPVELDGKAVLTAMLTNFYKLPQAKIDEILADGATADEVITKINALDKDRVKKLQGDKGKLTDAQRAQVVAETEAAIKEHYGIESDLSGNELYDHIISEKIKEGGATSEDAIKATPTYKALENKAKIDLANVKKDYEAKLTAQATEHKKNNDFITVSKFALEALDALNPVISANATVASTHRNNFVNELKGAEWAIGEDGSITVMKDGKVIDDGHGNPLDAETYVKNIAAKHFEFSNNNGSSNPGGDDGKGGKVTPPPPPPAKYPAGITKPKNAEELAVIMRNDKLPAADKRVVMEQFQKDHPNE